MIRVESAFHDVAYFIGAALTIEDRRAHELEIVEHYLRTLEKFGVESLFTSDREVAMVASSIYRTLLRRMG
jgi:hypothetical protein